MARRPSFPLAVSLLLATSAFAGGRVEVTYAPGLSDKPLDGRLLLLFSTNDTEEPRFQISAASLDSQQIFGIEMDGWKPGTPAIFDGSVLGYPVESLDHLKAGTYTVQALLHKYETFHLADGRTLKLPMDRGEGQHWNLAPGNLLSTPTHVAIDPGKGGIIHIRLESAIPPIPEPKETEYVKHLRIRSERLSRFWGRDMYLGAHVLLPLGFEQHKDARYPLVIDHGHFPATFEGFREVPPDPDLKCDYSDRFHLKCYNRIQQQAAYQLYKDWTSAGFPRAIIIQIQHPNPYYDDSYAVDSSNLGPYGEAIVQELLPAVETKFRALGAGWARFMYGGSTGGWEALADQVFYPDSFNGVWVACPDPIDFHAYVTVDVYKDRNAYMAEGPFKTVPRPGQRDYLGHVSSTLEQMNRLELVVGPKNRSGEQFDIWNAVYSPAGSDGYPAQIWNKRTGDIDKTVAEFWKNHYDLDFILQRDWDKGLGKKLEGKLHIYVGEADNYYLNNAVYLAEDFLKQTKDPNYKGEVDYASRAEHCWNGDHTRPNSDSRLRYAQMFLPKVVERILSSAPAGADLTSWRY